MCRFFATSPRGVSELLRDELLSFGAESVKVQPSGATFEGDMEVGYRACLWSRLANRIFYTVLDQELDNQDAMLDAVSQIDWLEHLDVNSTFSVSFSGQGLGITHTNYGALKIKDGVVDYFREQGLDRPSIDKETPDLRIHSHVNRNKLTIGIDLSGHSLHQRGYREGLQVTAPLKENIAAAILMRANWINIAKQGGAFYDPMCGSATFLIEAAMMASDCAPGLVKAAEKGLVSWKQYDEELWKKLQEEAQARETEGLKNLPDIFGSDISHRSLDIATETIYAAGYSDIIEIKQMSVTQGRRWGNWQAGLIVCNPPYGERMGELEEVKQVYMQLGDYLKLEFSSWQAAVLTCHSELGMYLGIKAKRSHDFYNGAMECKLFRFDVEEKWFRESAMSANQDLAAQIERLQPDLKESDGARMLANRLKKNKQNLKGWIKQKDIQAYRVYDADLPEYALAIDFYHTLEGVNWLMVAEYAAPKSINPAKARRRLYEAMSILPSAFDLPADRVVYKVRSQKKGSEQYERLEEQKTFFTVQEGIAKLRVNFTDYLDTGLFLDHREVRQYVAKLSGGKSLLNLFCYTAAATVQAALAGAKSSLSVDMSKTYLYWAKHNYMNNKINQKTHLLKQVDIIEWLKVESVEPTKKFEVIFLDPPSFSTSKRMESTLDIQCDHVEIIKQALCLLTPDGKLIFSNNRKKFKLDIANLEELWDIKDLTSRTMPKDFARNSNIHQVWQLSRRS